MTNAPLVDNFLVDCVMLSKKRVPDGQGGFLDAAWADDVPFKAAIVKDNSIQARIAEQEGVTSVYTVTAPKGIGLDYHEVFRRVSDGAIFRVTSDSQDSETPEVASFQFEQVTAERWELA